MKKKLGCYLFGGILVSALWGCGSSDSEQAFELKGPDSVNEGSSIAIQLDVQQPLSEFNIELSVDGEPASNYTIRNSIILLPTPSVTENTKLSIDVVLTSQAETLSATHQVMVVDRPFEVSLNGPTELNEREVIQITIDSTIPLGSFDTAWFVNGSRYWGYSSSGVFEYTPQVTADTTFVFELRAQFGDETVTRTHEVFVFNKFDVEQDHPVVVENTYSMADDLLKFGGLVKQIIQEMDFSNSTSDQICSNGGLATTEFVDKDASDSVSTQDTLTITYKDCEVSSLNYVLTDTLEITIEDYNMTAGSFDAVLSLKRLELTSYYESYQYSGELEISYSQQNLTDDLIVKSLSQFSVSKDDREALKQVNLTVTKSENYPAAKYEISIHGTYQDESVDKQISLEQKEPFSGFFKEYPYEGSLELSIEGGYTLSLESNYVTNSESVNVVHEEFERSISWSSLVSDYFWGVHELEAQWGSYTKAFRNDNFDYLGNLSGTDDIPLSGKIDLLFSRPVAQIASQDIQFRSYSWPYVNIDTSMVINGAVVTIKANDYLEADKKYRLDGFSAVSTNEQNENSYSILFTTSNSVIPKISASAPVFNESGLPQLDASQSILNKGKSAEYTWLDINNIGLTFTSPNAASTEFTLPEGFDGEDIEIGVMISNEFTEQAVAQVTLQYLPESGNYIHVAGESGDYISGGQTWVLTDNDGAFSTTASSENKNYIDLSFRGEEHWGLRVAAVEGEQLAVGEYTGATRYPFQSPTTPGLSFSGDGRGCNNSYSSFEIFDISYGDDGTLSKLAINFTQHCESPNAPKLNGFIRFNSDVPLFPEN